MEEKSKIIWTIEAIQNLENIIKYLEVNWTEKEIQNFIKKLNKAISLISIRPNLFRLTEKKKNLRRCVLTKQTTIYFKSEYSIIFIVSLFDNRQDPAKFES